ncbi:hypothetical protein GGI12_002311 [Dipsacomyces acuminosporus]|nr:hypothetical protein GGI12_002311 [Dipsacomyces acuminosporus]
MGDPSVLYDDCSRVHRFFRLHAFNPHRVSGSRALGPGGIAAVRAVLFAYALTVWVFTIVRDAHKGAMNGHFAYFTNLCYTGLLAYLTSSLFHSVQNWRRGSPSSFTNMPYVLQLLHWVLFSSVLVYAVIVTVIFWSVLFDISKFSNTADLWSTTSVHALNTVFILIDMFLGAMALSPHWSHPMLLAFVGLLYVMLAYLNEAVNGWFTYGFLNYKKLKGFESLIILGIFVALLIVYYALYGIQLLLDRWLPLRGYQQKAGAEYTQCEHDNSEEDKV